MPTKNKHRARPWDNKKELLPLRSANDEFYNDPVWRSTSKAFLAEHPECQCDDCDEREAIGKSRLLADMTDHVIPIEYGGARYDWRNFQAINKRVCHQKKRGKERHGIIEPSIRTPNGLIPRRIRR